MIMPTKEELLQELDQLNATIKNIMEGGQEFDTRDGRVKFPALRELYARRAEVQNALAVMECGSSGANTVLIKFGGFD